MLGYRRSDESHVAIFNIQLLQPEILSQEVPAIGATFNCSLASRGRRPTQIHAWMEDPQTLLIWWQID